MKVRTGFMCLHFAVVVVLLEMLFLLLTICSFLLLFLNVIMFELLQKSHFSGRLSYLMRVEFDGAFHILLNIGRISCGLTFHSFFERLHVFFCRSADNERVEYSGVLRASL